MTYNILSMDGREIYQNLVLLPAFFKKNLPAMFTWRDVCGQECQLLKNWHMPAIKRNLLIFVIFFRWMYRFNGWMVELCRLVGWKILEIIFKIISFVVKSTWWKRNSTFYFYSSYLLMLQNLLRGQLAATGIGQQALYGLPVLHHHFPVPIRF